MNQKIVEYGGDILKEKKFLGMKNYMQHGRVSVLEHSLRVAETSLRMSESLKKLGINLNEKELVRGALLHDYFLYDWHEKSDWHRLHGFSHAERALKNASRDFDLTYREKEIIRCHMFPLNITKVPTVKEAWVVTMADKYVSLIETIAMRKNRV